MVSSPEKKAFVIYKSLRVHSFHNDYSSTPPASAKRISCSNPYTANPVGFLAVKLMKTHFHDSAHTASSNFWELPYVCFYPFMAPLPLFPGKKIWMAVYPNSLLSPRKIIDFQHFFPLLIFTCCIDQSKMSKPLHIRAGRGNPVPVIFTQALEGPTSPHSVETDKKSVDIQLHLYEGKK